jgi:hypothetical protein
VQELKFYMCLKDDAPLAHGEAPIVFEDAEEAFEALAGDEEAVVAELTTETIISKLEGGGIEELIYKPAYDPPRLVPLKDFARMIAEIEEGVNKPEVRERILKEAVLAELREVLTEMDAEGVVEFDPDTDTYRSIGD